jgi:hypothetical protein
MAIDVFKRQGKSAVTGLLGKNLRRIAGNVGSVLRGDIGSNSSETAPLNRSKQSTKMLSFPIDVGADPGIGNHGHYIMFFINEQTNAKLKFGESESANGLDSLVNEAKRRGIGGITKEYDSKKDKFIEMQNDPLKNIHDSNGKLTEAAKQIQKDAKKHENKESHKIDTTVAIQRAPTTRLDTAISMYMPAQVSVKYNAEYTNTEIGVLTGSAVDVVEALMAGKDVNMEKLGKDVKDAGVAMEKTAIGMVGDLGPGLKGLKEAAEMKKGVISSDRMELAFKGIDKRSFSYEFKMIPKSQAEADEIKKIINAFKFNMLPEMPNGLGGRQMTVPNTFDIQYMYQNAENNYLHRISTCFLESMDVKYGGSRYKTFDGNADGAPPVETSISLEFKEIELITRERAQEGF